MVRRFAYSRLPAFGSWNARTKANSATTKKAAIVTENLQPPRPAKMKGQRRTLSLLRGVNRSSRCHIAPRIVARLSGENRRVVEKNAVSVGCWCYSTHIRKPRRRSRTAYESRCSFAIIRRSRWGSVLGCSVVNLHFFPGGAPQVGQRTKSACFGASFFTMKG
jgi:hypothetical protein